MVIGQTGSYRWDYSERSDILNVHRIGALNAGSAESEDFTLDFDDAGHLIGVEILNARAFLHAHGITDTLTDIESLELIVREARGQAIPYLKLTFHDHVEHLLPIPMTVAV